MPLLPMTPGPVWGNKGAPVTDARLSVYLGGTTQPAPIYTAPDLANRLPNPVPVNGFAILPPAYAPAGTYRLRATDGFGLVLFDTDGIQLVDPTTGGGGTTIPPGAVLDMYRTGTVSGWVRMNGRSIGSSASSATERANDDTNALFLHLWGQDPNLAVSGGRGSTAAGDWAANKTIALPDQRGRARIALDDMANTAALRLVGGLFAFGTATTLGAYGGEAAHQLTTSQLASFTPSYSAAYTDAQGGHNHTGTTDGAGGHAHTVASQRQNAYGPGTNGAVNTVADPSAPNFSGNTNSVGDHAHTFTTSSVGNHSHTVTVTFNSVGGDQAHNTLPPFLLVTAYVKL